MSTQELLQKRAALIHKQEEMLKTAYDEKRNMNVDEYESFKKMDEEIVNLEATIDADKKVQDRLSSLDETYNPISLSKPVKTSEPEPEISFGEACVAAALQANPNMKLRNGSEIMNKVNKIKAAATGHSANVPSDGGFLISPTLSKEIMQKLYEQGAIVGRCATYEIGEYSDSLEIPYVEETSRAAGSRWGGLRVYREGEVDSPTSSKTAIGKWECRVEDAKALVYVTERLLNDAPAMESWIMDLMPQEYEFKLEDEILNGTGGNQCKGIIGDTATVSVTKETGQASSTIVFENIVKMWSRAWGRGRPNSVWLYNQDAEPQLFSMVLSAGTSGVPVFLPANGLSGSPYATLMGRPMIPVEQAASVGTVGDLILADFSQYALVRKGGLKSASSIHVRFIYDEMVFKFNMRVNGKPKWKAKLTPYKGANDLSPFVTLASR